MSNDYYSKPSKDVDMSKSSSYVRAKLYPHHVEGVGISYRRHFRTKEEIKHEIAKLKTLSLSQEEYNRRLKYLKEELESRNQSHSAPCSKCKVKTDNMQSVRKSQSNLMDYLYTNFDCPFVRMGTLTYAVKVYDIKISVNDFQPFRKKFKAMFPDAVWLAYFDFGKDKSLHIHFIFKNAKRCYS